MEKTMRRAGRPLTETPKAGVGGKGRVITINVSSEMREALEAEAERNGRPMSQIAERWMEDGRKGRAALEKLVGGHVLVPAFERLGSVASAVQAANLDPQAERIALQSALSMALTFVLPHTPSPIFQRFEDESARLRTRCALILEEIEAAGEESPIYQAALSPIEEFMEAVPGSLLGKLRIGATVGSILKVASETGARGDLKRALERLAVHAATASVLDALSLCETIEQLAIDMSRTTKDAAETGIRIAQEALGIPLLPRATA